MAAAALPLHAGAASPQCDAAPGTFFNVFTGSLETIMVPVVTGSLEITNASVLPSVAGSVEGKVAAPTDVNWASVPAGAVVNFLTGNLILPAFSGHRVKRLVVPQTLLG